MISIQQLLYKNQTILLLNLELISEIWFCILILFLLSSVLLLLSFLYFILGYPLLGFTHLACSGRPLLYIHELLEYIHHHNDLLMQQWNGSELADCIFWNIDSSRKKTNIAIKEKRNRKTIKTKNDLIISVHW